MAVLDDFRAELQQEIDLRERRELDALRPPVVDPVHLLDEHCFVRVRGISNPRPKDGHGDNFLQCTVDLVTGAHGYSNYLTVVLAGTPEQLAVYVSLSSDAATCARLLGSAYPGVYLEDDSVHGLGTVLDKHFTHAGMISGVPSLEPTSASMPAGVEQLPSGLERVIHGMRGATWIIVVQAYPRQQLDSIAAREELLERVAAIASLSRQQVQRSAQASSARTNRKTEVVSETLSGEVVNRRADYAVELLELEIKRLEKAISTGRWQVATYFGAAEGNEARRLGALLSGVLSGPGSRPDPIRVHFCSRSKATTASQFHTYLSSEELARLIQLPREEAPGYAVADLTRFDVDVETPTGRSLSIGQIFWDGIATSKEYRIATDDLTRHGVVIGVTGSGKTTSLLSLLSQAWHETKTPFLVLEPAKTEYRALLGQVRSGRASGPIPGLRLYTLGDDLVAPFRLNPFEFDLGDSPGGAAVLSHIDFLKAIFNAAFILYAPMPYVLETALHEVYEDKGWNLATGTNVWLTDQGWQQRHLYPIFPTLTDLYHKVEAVTGRLGYEARIEQDVVAGLKARLGALRLGAKGLMLDTPRGIPMSELLAEPTILELESIGNDDEKTFLMGLLLTRLYSYRRLQATEGKLPAGLQHLLVIEEAHRLLKNVSTQVDTEASNLRAHAIETFVNMLSEVRHYGQGVLVAEQIPTKLTPDVIKNTNLKLVHRLLARDDRELLGATMAMDEAQTRHLAILRVGQAVVYAEGDDHPCLLKIDDFKARGRLRSPATKALPELTDKYIALQRYLPVPEFESYGIQATHYGAPDVVAYQSALRHLARSDARHTWAILIACTIFARQNLLTALQRVRQQIAVEPGQLAVSQYGETLIIIMVFGVMQALHDRQAENAWPYPVIRAMQQSLTVGLVKLARTTELRDAALDLDRFVRAYEANTTREWGPYPGCEACQAVCFYRSEVRRLVSSNDMGHARGILGSPAFRSVEERYAELGKLLKAVVEQWLGGHFSESKNLGYCAGLILASALRLDEYEQATFGRQLARQMLA